ncbi:MAG: carboxypeptidase M32 [Candidatus Zixiibacteriota bacterium]|nr:MAG: carboxypeptidase M32 [candidate division Zixibacteria bacterium]
MSANDAYAELIKRTREVNLIARCAAVLHWDQETNMPKGGGQYRGEQMAYLSGLAHKKSTDPEIGELLSQTENSDLVKDEFSDEAVNIREIRRDYDKSVKVPQKLVEEIARTRTISQQVWVEARQKSDFSLFLPNLEKIIKLDRELADHLGYEKEAYDALLDNYEPGMTCELVSKTFADLRDELVKLVAAITASGKKPNMAIVEQDFDVHRQKIFGQEAAAAIGYNFHDGRLDISTHPFTAGLGPHDTRITTRYNPKHLGQAFFGTMHEGGHAIYDQNLDSKHFGTPRGEFVSLGIHESQSLMWENMVGRSRPFWRHFFPRARQVFPEALAGVAFDDFFFAINNVRPSFIRVEADEVTYNLHIMLRFEIELAFLRGELAPKDIPGAWNDKFKDYLGITPPDDAQGCLQDMHWSSAVIGYFPTYALGNLYGAQFFAKAREDMPDLDEQFAAGDFSELKNWLVKNIHLHGKRYRAEKLVEVVTGRRLSHQPAVNYLKTKYGELYGL